MKKITFLLLMLISANYSYSQLPWTFTNTGTTHTILMQGTIPVTIDGVQVSTGDYLGVFYDVNGGGLACAGYGQWTGNQISILAYGTQPGLNNGFATGESFKWNIWRASDSQEFDAQATYIIAMPNQGNFAAGGYSGLTSLVAISPLQINVVLSQVSCFGDSTGAIDITVSGGQEPFSYLWSTGATTEDITGLPAGIYFLSLVDATNQTLIDSFEITQPASEIILTLTKTDVSVQNAGDGTIDLTVSGGTPPYSFLWSNTPTTEDLYGLSAGIFAVTITDFNLCSISASIEIFDTIQSQTLYLPSGWSIFSSYLSPVHHGIDSIMSPILSNVLIVKDADGRVFWPYFNLNMIGDVSIGYGYQIKLNNADTLDLEGISIQPENTPIVFNAGWNIMGYLRITPAPIDSMLTSILSNIINVKNELGQAYWPYFGMNQIGNILLGKGYQLNLANKDTLIFPPNENTSPFPFLCGASIITDYDGNIYNTVQIGNQCWMKENLNVGIMIIGSSYQTNNGIIEKYCYNDISAYCDTFGGLYKWDEIMIYTNTEGIQGICPVDWHIPTDSEWNILEGFVDSVYEIGNPIWNSTGWRGSNSGKMLKSNFGWYNNGNGTNEYNFSGLPAGNRYYQYSSYDGLTSYNDFWTSTEIHNTGAAWEHYMEYHRDDIGRHDTNKGFGHSVRCLKDSLISQASLPTIMSDTLTNITQTTATCGGDVTNDGVDIVTARGICWNTTGSPTLADSLTSDGSGVGSFVSYLTGLTPNTTYYVRAYATNSVGTAYGNEVQFTTLPIPFVCGNTISDFDGNTYNTVLIGNQCWMKENLKTTHYSDGSALVDGTNAGNISYNYSTKYYFDYNNNTANTAIYGKLYTWAAAMNGVVSSNTVPSGVQGVCPAGWHVPGDEEWKILEGTVDSQYGYPNSVWNSSGYRGYDAGKNLKATTGWISNTGTNLYGFSALPGGYRNDSGNFVNLGLYGTWWSSSESSTADAWYRRLDSYNDSVIQYDYDKSQGNSVRCLKD